MRRPTPSLALAGLALTLLVLTGCGNERQSAPETPRAAPAVGKRTVVLPRWGVSFVRPANWGMSEGAPPHIAAVGSGQVAINLWRYRRQERLPRSPGELQRARRALIAAARARDRSLRILSARAVRRGGAPGVELVANERIGIARRRVRSTHLYAHGAELVVDAYAPPPQFGAVDRSVFLPLLRSLRVSRPAPARRP